jgi:hypothetical protein
MMGKSRPTPAAHTWFAIGLLYCGKLAPIETCPACGGALRIIACIEDPAVINKILTHIESKNACAEPARLPPCRAPPQARWF